MWDVSCARQRMPELLDPMPNYACWLGSVSIDDKLKFSEFMSMAKQGDLQGLAQYQQIGGNLAYGVLLNFSNNQWKLVIIQSPESPSLREQPVFTAVIHPTVSIEVYHRKETDIEDKLKKSSHIGVFDIFKKLFKINIFM
jgi:hypothetical protein